MTTEEKRLTQLERKNTMIGVSFSEIIEMQQLKTKIKRNDKNNEKSIKDMEGI